MGGYLMGMDYSYTIDRYKASADRAPIQTFLSMCAEIEKLKAENNRLYELVQELRGNGSVRSEQTTIQSL